MIQLREQLSSRTGYPKANAYRLIVHVQIVKDEKRLNCLDHFYRNNEGDRNNILK